MAIGILIGFIIGLIYCWVYNGPKVKERVKELKDSLDLEPKQGQYSSRNVCVKCEEHLTSKQTYYANGRCPHCGYKDVNSITVTATNRDPIRYDRVTSKWYLESVYDKLIEDRG